MKVKQSLRSLAIGLMGAFSSAVSAFAHAEVEMLDRIVAIVDETTVTQSELDRRLNDVVNRVRAAGGQLPPLSILRNQVLDQLVSETLQLNTAARYGVKATDQELRQSLNSIMAEQGINEQQLVQSLSAEGLSINEFRENLRRQLTIQSITQGLVAQRIRISEQDVDSFLQSADAKFWISPQYHLQHILIPIEGQGSAGVEAAQKKAGDIFQRLNDGANFTATAIAESKGPSALKGGDLGFRKSSELPTLFADVAPSLEIGDISEPFLSRAGFHILKLLDKRGETKEVITQSNVQHILIETNEILNKDQAFAKISDLRQQILNGADFKALAKEHSDDIGSKMSGGELGWSRPGLFVPEFEKAMNEAKVGEVTEPVASQFGWHVILVTERRDEDFSEELIRQRARNFLIGRRFEDEVQLWLQEMRDQAFVELKI